MPRDAFTAVFGKPEGLHTALSRDGVSALTITGEGRFRARLTQVALPGIALLAAEEELPRSAFVVVPDDTIMVALPIGRGPWPVWAGIEMDARQIITLGPGERLYVRTNGFCCWGTIRLGAKRLSMYSRAITGERITFPLFARWRPPRGALRHLLFLHRAAVHAAEIRSRALVDVTAAHGLEQQLIHTLIECLAGAPDQETLIDRRKRDMLARFEAVLSTEPSPRINDICVTLGVSAATLRACCHKHLGMNPSRYCRLRAQHKMNHTGSRPAHFLH
jgi:hypothetical protein